jgi:hypothetical protein
MTDRMDESSDEITQKPEMIPTCVHFLAATVLTPATGHERSYFAAVF